MSRRTVNNGFNMLSCFSLLPLSIVIFFGFVLCIIVVSVGVKISNRIENITSSLIGIAFFPALYITATMNSLRDSYFSGIESFKYPFGYMYFNFLLLFFVLLIFSAIYRIKNGFGSSFFRKISVAVLISCTIVFLLNYLPCLYCHKDPHTLRTVILQSTLCPSYSIKSYIGLWLPSIIVFVALLISNGKIHKNSGCLDL